MPGTGSLSLKKSSRQKLSSENRLYRFFIFFLFLKKLSSNVGRTLLVFLLTPRAKLNACLTSGFTSVVQWVGLEPATT